VIRPGESGTDIEAQADCVGGQCQLPQCPFINRAFRAREDLFTSVSFRTNAVQVRCQFFEVVTEEVDTGITMDSDQCKTQCGFFCIARNCDEKAE
jgi:hypothetical protein